MSTAQDAGLSAACIGVIDVYVTLDALDSEFIIACIGGNTACILVSCIDCSIDCEVLNETATGDNAKEAEEILIGSRVKVKNLVSLTIEMTAVSRSILIACTPVTNRRPDNLSFFWVCFFWHQVSKVDVGSQNGIGVNGSLVYLHSEPCELLGIGNLVETISIGSHAIFEVETAIVAEAINDVVVVLSNFCIGVGIGCVSIGIAITVQASNHIDLSVSRVKHGSFIGAQSLIPADFRLVAIQCIAYCTRRKLLGSEAKG